MSVSVTLNMSCCRGSGCSLLNATPPKYQPAHLVEVGMSVSITIPRPLHKLAGFSVRPVLDQYSSPLPQTPITSNISCGRNWSLFNHVSWTVATVLLIVATGTSWIVSHCHNSCYYIYSLCFTLSIHINDFYYPFDIFATDKTIINTGRKVNKSN